MSFQLPESLNGLPNFCGAEQQVESVIQSSRGKPVFLPQSRIDFGRIRSAFANALHMHQPLIPAEGRDLASAEIVSNLKHMMDNPSIGDNYNAPVLQWCYKRMEGGSWTNNISWVRGYEKLLGPMEKASSHFHEKVLKPEIPTQEQRYRNALFHLLGSQSSDFRYWGTGIWTDYGREICRRLEIILANEF